VAGRAAVKLPADFGILISTDPGQPYRIIARRRFSFRDGRLLHGLRLGEPRSDSLSAFRQRASQDADLLRSARHDAGLTHQAVGHHDGGDRKIAAGPADQLRIG
jgi:hypothetical protein